ncbi:MAG: hypothetical protein JWO31_893 [Phycisphaerales bacterium]|nr:hypothetical protein [Phycisphaerales bacterium]
MPFLVRDQLLRVTQALPNGAAAVTSPSIDLEISPRSDFVANVELVVTAPALNVTQQPDAKTLTYDVVHSDNADLSSPAVLATAIGVQTGAAGAGAGTATYRYRPPTNVKRYIGVRATGSATGNSSTASFTAELMA